MGALITWARAEEGVVWRPGQRVLCCLCLCLCLVVACGEGGRDLVVWWVVVVVVVVGASAALVAAREGSDRVCLGGQKEKKKGVSPVGREKRRGGARAGAS